jgi:hypothetical protein
MTKKHIVGYSASFGLAIGIVMFLIGLALAYRADTFLTHLFMMVNAPALGLITRLHDTAYDWGSPAGLSQMFLVFLTGWTLFGTLAGLSLRRFLIWKPRIIAASYQS